MDDLIVHKGKTGQYVCDYHQGEATKVKKPYMPPLVEVVTCRVERGFAASGFSTLYLGFNKGVSSNGGVSFSNGAPPDNGSNLEGLGDGGSLYF